jgi:glycogen phosphorylase
MRPSHLITVRTVLPPELMALEQLARNLAWTWDEAAEQLYASVDEALWERTNHNPIQLLRLVDQRRLDQLAADPDYRAELAATAGRLLAAEEFSQPRVAYFSAEFGLAESLPIYAGGLGVLAGDHLKAASDRGLALAGVGLFYRQGFFRQVLSEDGWQMELYPDHDPADLPIEPVHDRRGGQLTLQLEYPGRSVALRVWCARVGRVPLYLLDTDFEPNEAADRDLTRRLYGGDRDLRLRQEILLGIGGLRALRALKHRPLVFHLNEGHAAFLALERIRELMQERSLTFGEARLAAAAGLVFTTHTPVPAGNDAFPPGMLDYYFGDYYREMGISRTEFLAQGRQQPHDESEPFSMTVLALRLCGASNAVSRLHGVVARRMWHPIWPNLPPQTEPIGSVTNGVHMPSWVAPKLTTANPSFGASAPSSGQAGRTTDEDARLWARHQALRRRLIGFSRERLVAQLARRGAGPAELAWAARVLHPEHLTIGFARRFAGYKRATLLLGDPDRLARLLNQADRPVQLLFAGKAHPHDDLGKELIRELVQLAGRPDFRPRLVFLEGYDLNVARHLVRGVDVWLNTPRRPLEASGTSGMKAVANGALHLSTLDGWWDEAFRPGLGWAIGDRRDYADPAEQDAADRANLFDLLEREVVPLFYDRDAAGLPRGWLAMMRASMAAYTPLFSAERMLAEYDDGFYRPALARATRLAGRNRRQTQRLAAWMERLEAAWPDVRVEQLRADHGSLAAGQPLRVEAVVQLAGLRADDVAVDLLLGPLDEAGELSGPREVRLKTAAPVRSGRGRYRSEPLLLEGSGRQGLLVRLTPRYPDLLPSQALGRARWGP